jgi:ribose transport system ATP-binding protein
VLSLASRVTVLRDGRCQGTISTSGVDRAHLARLIVGQEVDIETGLGPTKRETGVPVLSVRNLNCEPLRGVDFDVHPGEVLGFAGLSGSGREVLAGAVCGAVPARLALTLDGRALEVDGMTPALARDLRLALVLPNRHPQAAIPVFTIAENMTLGRLPEFAKMGRIERRRERQAVLDWIKRLDIRPADPDRPYGLLSGGNQQKVLLAKWFGLEPRVVFMDDPTSGVDIGARYAIYELIRAHASTGAGFVVCSSDIEDLVGVCDRVLALIDGRIVEALEGQMITESEVLRAISAAGDRLVGTGRFAEQ